MTRTMLAILVVCLLNLYPLQTHAKTGSSNIEDSKITGQEILRGKIESLQKKLSQFKCDVQYALINARIYLQNASESLEDSLEASNVIDTIYLTIAENYYTKAEGYLKIAKQTCSSK